MTQKRQISELSQRILTAAALVPVVIWLTYQGGGWYQLLVLVLAALLALELINNLGMARSVLWRPLAVMLFVGSGIMSIYGDVWTAFATGVAGSIVFTALSGLKGVRVTILAAGILIGNSAVVAFIALRSGSEYGLIVLLWLFGVVWSADTLAYFSGRLIGGPRLAPKISPNKTWAGFAGGIVGAAGAGYILSRYVDGGSVIVVTGLSAIAAIVAQAGDLQESWAKRQLGVKDSGRLLPGHGGVWDRLDALIVVAIFATVIGLVRGDGQSIAHNLLIW